MCCGKMQPPEGATALPQTEPKASPPAAQSAVIFKYIGQTGIVVIGPVSGRRYRFDEPGARIIVDPRDRPGLARVPQLRQVR